VVIVGLAGGAVREAADRVRSAIQATGEEFPRQRIVVNLAPADLPKTRAALDLPIAVGILAASKAVSHGPLVSTVFAGELALSGALRPIRGALSIALMARSLGLHRVVVPRDNGPEVAMLGDIEVRTAQTLGEVVTWLKGGAELPEAAAAPLVEEHPALDLADVRGQLRARRALEIAAAGGHNLLMVGPPGCGKSMLAARLPSILPALTFEESLELTRIHSAAGLLRSRRGVLTRRPFRAPHHSISTAGLVGNAKLQPGEISLAHHGVLFLDEVTEFAPATLDLMRGPLEDRQIRICRASGQAVLPASFSLVAAANPCSCGFAGNPRRACVCLPSRRERHRTRLSGPLLDRIDLKIWMDPVPPESLTGAPQGEPSAVVRRRVEQAHRLQHRRNTGQGGLRNAELPGRVLLDVGRPTSEAVDVLRQVTERAGLSARGWARTLRVARTIADLGGETEIAAGHMLEASTYRLEVA